MPPHGADRCMVGNIERPPFFDAGGIARRRRWVRPPHRSVNHGPATRSRYAAAGWPESHRTGVRWPPALAFCHESFEYRPSRRRGADAGEYAGGIRRCCARAAMAPSWTCNCRDDGVVVVHHDFRLMARTWRAKTGAWLDQPGPRIKDLTWAEAAAVRCGIAASGQRLCAKASPDARASGRQGAVAGRGGRTGRETRRARFC